LANRQPVVALPLLANRLLVRPRGFLSTAPLHATCSLPVVCLLFLKRSFKIDAFFVVKKVYKPLTRLTLMSLTPTSKLHELLGFPLNLASVRFPLFHLMMADTILIRTFMT
jgi:hypothetical protein